MTDNRPGSPFRDLHNRAGAFIIPNPWDAGSAKILAALGFEALATTSGGFAHSLARKDGAVTPAEVLAHCRAIVAATPLPVSADLEKGFGDTPEFRRRHHTAGRRYRSRRAPRSRIFPAIRPAAVRFQPCGRADRGCGGSRQGA